MDIGSATILLIFNLKNVVDTIFEHRIYLLVEKYKPLKHRGRGSSGPGYIQKTCIFYMSSLMHACLSLEIIQNVKKYKYYKPFCKISFDNTVRNLEISSRFISSIFCWPIFPASLLYDHCYITYMIFF